MPQEKLTGKEKLSFDLAVKEYERLTDDIRARSEYQERMLNHTIVLTAAAAGGIFTLTKEGVDNTQIAVLILVYGYLVLVLFSGWLFQMSFQFRMLLHIAWMKNKLLKYLDVGDYIFSWGEVNHWRKSKSLNALLTYGWLHSFPFYLLILSSITGVIIVCSREPVLFLSPIYMLLMFLVIALFMIVALQISMHSITFDELGQITRKRNIEGPESKGRAS